MTEFDDAVARGEAMARTAPHFSSWDDGSAYSCGCDIGEDHHVDAWVTCPGCRQGIDAGDIRQSGTHTLTAGCFFADEVTIAGEAP